MGSLWLRLLMKASHHAIILGYLAKSESRKYALRAGRPAPSLAERYQVAKVHT
jgi:hypothetical protein